MILTSSEVVATMNKEILLCGIVVWEKKWEDGNRSKGGKRNPEDTCIFLAL